MRYRVTMPFVGFVHYDVEADDEEQALERDVPKPYEDASHGLSPQHGTRLSLAIDPFDYDRAEAEPIEAGS